MQESPHAVEMHILENFFACLACLPLQNKIGFRQGPRIATCADDYLPDHPGRKIFSIEKILPEIRFLP
jgi:hypothetical protein